MKTSELTEPKTLVLLSSVLAWVNTPAKFTEEKAEGAEDDEAEAEPEEEEEPEEENGEDKEEEKNEGPLDEEGNPIPRAKPLYFKETDYHLRVPHEKYQHFKTLETLAISSVTT